jgi:very-short-patch-repair endonuclease
MPHQSVPAAKRNFARSLRRDMTEAEDKLWHELRSRRLDRIKFRRQVPIGCYIADFACLEAKLIVEIDGSQHADSVRDHERDAELRSRGFRILRFWNDEALRELDAV